MPVSCGVATLAAMHAALLRRSVPGLGAALLVAVVAGCGDPVPQGDAPLGTGVRVGGVSYDVQTARDLDPASPGDRSFFADAPRAGRGLPADQFVPKGLLNAYNERQKTRSGAGAVTTVGSPE